MIQRAKPIRHRPTACYQCGASIDPSVLFCSKCGIATTGPDHPMRYCCRCGAIGEPVTVTKGSFWIELLLWFAMILPGALYSVWRLTTRHRGCGGCYSPDIVPLDAPVARKAVAAMGPELISGHQ